MRFSGFFATFGEMEISSVQCEDGEMPLNRDSGNNVTTSVHSFTFFRRYLITFAPQCPYDITQPVNQIVIRNDIDYVGILSPQ